MHWENPSWAEHWPDQLPLKAQFLFWQPFSWTNLLHGGLYYTGIRIEEKHLCPCCIDIYIYGLSTWILNRNCQKWDFVSMCDSAVGMEPYFPSDSPFERPPHPSPFPSWIRFSPSPPAWIRFLLDCCHQQFPTNSQTYFQFCSCMKYEELLSCYLAL